MIRTAFFWLAHHFTAALGATVGAYLVIRYRSEEAVAFSDASGFVLLGYFLAMICLLVFNAISREARGEANTKYINLIGVLVTIGALCWAIFG